MKGSSFEWERIADPVYQGSQAGTCMYFPDLDGNGRADTHGVKGTWANEAETWYNPSCGLEDTTGDDPEGVVDPELPEQKGNPLDGPGPGEPGNGTPGIGDGNDCRDLDQREWRSVPCDHPMIQSHVDHTDEERWNGIDVPGAWKSTIEYWQCRALNDLPNDDFSDVVRFESLLISGRQKPRADMVLD